MNITSERFDRNGVIEWLLKGDPAIQFLTRQFLQNEPLSDLLSLRKQIETEGFGARLLASRNPNGHWGCWFYQPKWTCTHYTLMDLKGLGIDPACSTCREMVTRIFEECQLDSGGLNFAKTYVSNDICVDAMVLDYGSYFCPDEPRLEGLAAHILASQKPDGGFSWDNASPHGDPHTTICALEGFFSYRKAGFFQHIDAIRESGLRAMEFFYANELFIRDDGRFRRTAYPSRYRYDLLRLMEDCAAAGEPFDSRMRPGLEWLRKKQRSDGRWNLDLIHPGNQHFSLETPHEPSRFITLKAMRIFDCYPILEKTFNG